MAEGNGVTGVALLAMGGPASLGEIRDYLRRLFEDPMLIRLPGGRLFRRPLAAFVSKRRAERVAHRYEQIGGASPLLAETLRLRDLVVARLGAPVEIAMRYSRPTADEAVDALCKAGVARVVAIPLYPQFSTSTSASSLADFARAAAGRLELTGVSDHFSHPGFVAGLASQIQRAISTFKSLERTHVLYTAHSVPESLTEGGDPYISQVKSTIEAVARELYERGVNLPSSLAFQSRVKFGRWHGPAVEDEVSDLHASGVRRLVVAPVSFVSENLETKFDLDIELHEQLCDEGFVEVARSGTLSDSPEYADALAALAHDAAEKSFGGWR